ncbi:hypothetical protein E1N52_27115 [Paraburkholderia guartelaensis]|uniref:Uncharacterized protein n=1 Tax=Paraburkholderia guartelaensis TaxID=2546446 RepID=A0A4R5L848_9BURK|nr:hypothetical protein [Paraburkholderia guartelaensis]TDG05108.1 hypothetical protein E1N52_27115 [Paraburkholderia guartelaensis]
MRAASTELTRICLIGGDWEGHRVESSLHRFTGTADYAEDFDEFDAVVSDFINFSPYIHYDPETKNIVKVTTDLALCAVGGDGLMYEIVGLDVVKMRMPEDDTLYEWYLAYAGIHPRSPDGGSAEGNRV